MKYVKDFILDLDLAEEIKAELVDESLLKKHWFYLNLATLISSAFGEVAEEDVKRITVFGYLYFRFSLSLDAVLDTTDKPQSSQMVRRLLGAIKVHEQALLGLARLFPAGDPFWKNFDTCKSEYHRANLLEKDISQNHSPYSQELFAEVAAGKSAICYAMVYALDSLSHSTGPVQDLKSCLRNLHIAMQHLDDLDDFKADFLTGQFTYAHFLVEQHLAALGIEANTLSLTDRHRHLYTSGVANQMLAQATEYYDKSIALARSLGLADLATDIQLRADKGKNYQREIEQLLRKTKIKAAKSLALVSSSPMPGLQWSLQAGLQQALDYIKHNRDAQGCWTDFMTSAGQSTLWVTAYTGLLLAETTQGSRMAHDAFDASFFLPMSYNDSILQDGDSTTFAMGLRYKVWGETTQSQLADWLRFMDADGGWVTYRNASALRKRLVLPPSVGVEAWLTPKLCVTAAAAYVLKMHTGLATQYEASCTYLATHQHPDGYWLSYWWTSPIYATSFALLALGTASAYAHHRESGMTWLAAQQAGSGAWLDATSNEQPSAFFTALAIKALLTDKSGQYTNAVLKGVSWLLANQTTDGSWIASRILRIPATDVTIPSSVREWRTSSFGVNTLIDDHNRIFTTSTVLNALSLFAKAGVTELLTHH